MFLPKPGTCLTTDIMPIGETETHPYLEQGQINGSTKLILRSFPVYECTNPDNQIKQQNRQNERPQRPLSKLP